MDLIYSNAEMEDIGILHDYQFDLAFGSGENDFEIKIDQKRHCCEGGFFVYMEGTEYGGIIDDIKSETGTREITYHGRTWHGILNSKCILPLHGGDVGTEDVELRTEDGEGISLVDKYLIVSGDANRVIEWLLERIGLSWLYSVPQEDSGIQVIRYQFDRYIMGYEGIVKMLRAAGAKLKLHFSSGKVYLQAMSRMDYSADEQFDSDLMAIKIKRTFHPTNHIICLGKGELEQREVIHLYMDSQGNISEEQYLTGRNEIVEVYDYSSAESTEELIKGGTERLKEAWGSRNVIETDFDSDSCSFDIGDIVGAMDQFTGLEGRAEIKKKIVTIQRNQINISYKVG